MLYLNRAAPAAVADDVAAIEADLTVVLELTGEVHAQLASRFAHVWGRPVDGSHFGIGVYGRVPFSVVGAPDLDGAEVSAVTVQVATAAGPVRVHGVHVRPPWRRGHLTSREHLVAVERLGALAAAEAVPTVVAGDLNLCDRCQGYRRLAAALVDAMRAAPTGPTYVTPRWRVACFRIDHLLLPQGWAAAAPGRVRVAGSDHLGVVATVGPASVPRSKGRSGPDLLEPDALVVPALGVEEQGDQGHVEHEPEDVVLQRPHVEAETDVETEGDGDEGDTDTQAVGGPLLVGDAVAGQGPGAGQHDLEPRMGAGEKKVGQGDLLGSTEAEDEQQDRPEVEQVDGDLHGLGLVGVHPAAGLHGDSLAGVVLAAGAGTRLRPLTDLRPKALCPVGNVALVDGAIERLREVTSAIAVNAHHRRDQLEDYLAGRDVYVSVEADEALGTAGALGFLRPWIGGRPVVVTNADAWLRVDLRPFVAGWDGRRVRLLVVPDPERGDFGDLRYAGVALLPWEVVRGFEPVPSGLYEVCWRPAWEQGALDLVVHDGAFVDCGTPADYLAANLLASGGESVIAPSAVVEGVVERSVVWPDSVVARGEVLRDAIRAGPFTVAAG
jgi:hypothetical protein